MRRHVSIMTCRVGATFRRFHAPTPSKAYTMTNTCHRHYACTKWKRALFQRSWNMKKDVNFQYAFKDVPRSLVTHNRRNLSSRHCSTELSVRFTSVLQYRIKIIHGSIWEGCCSYAFANKVNAATLYEISTKSSNVDVEKAGFLKHSIWKKTTKLNIYFLLLM